MARATVEIIEFLRSAAIHLEQSDDYQWGHMGACNCGFLAQVVTKLSKSEIHRRAMLRCGDWTEQLNDYCPSSGLLFDSIISQLIEAGFDRHDLRHLETLSLPEVLSELSAQQLNRNNKRDAIRYLRVWSDLLERRLLDKVRLPSLASTPFHELA